MRRQKIEGSRAISEIGYGAGVLEVMFASGHVYRYFPVAAETWEQLMRARSRGGELHRMLKAGIYTTEYAGQSGVKAAAYTGPVATPVYLTLLQTRQILRKNPQMGFMYAVWQAAGKEAGAKALYRQCLEVLAETAGAAGRVGAAHLEGAIELAKERRV